ncbi:hypothetical protein NEOLEDRAFT_336475 [Neolentinus lepideus HHB14362 ss-1]|uniref:Uncharacterized protein n=1 Tax=Neolentinus lepideus HHB14362 ss-1 TaxID=1314782 RepID=A0A165SVA1_9AGAM|nr:hypothetical protein NEOLEDRAFT_336475 [Neolentinus lepideus HHB14362 ss-1]
MLLFELVLLLVGTFASLSSVVQHTNINIATWLPLGLGETVYITSVITSGLYVAYEGLQTPPSSLMLASGGQDSLEHKFTANTSGNIAYSTSIPTFSPDRPCHTPPVDLSTPHAIESSTDTPPVTSLLVIPPIDADSGSDYEHHGPGASGHDGYILAGSSYEKWREWLLWYMTSKYFEAKTRLALDKTISSRAKRTIRKSEHINATHKTTPAASEDDVGILFENKWRAITFALAVAAAILAFIYRFRRTSPPKYNSNVSQGTSKTCLREEQTSSVHELSDDSVSGDDVQPPVASNSDVPSPPEPSDNDPTNQTFYHSSALQDVEPSSENYLDVLAAQHGRYSFSSVDSTALINSDEETPAYHSEEEPVHAESVSGDDAGSSTQVDSDAADSPRLSSSPQDAPQLLVDCFEATTAHRRQGLKSSMHCPDNYKEEMLAFAPGKERHHQPLDTHPMDGSEESIDPNSSLTSDLHDIVAESSVESVIVQATMPEDNLFSPTERPSEVCASQNLHLVPEISDIHPGELSERAAESLGSSDGVKAPTDVPVDNADAETAATKEARATAELTSAVCSLQDHCLPPSDPEPLPELGAQPFDSYLLANSPVPDVEEQAITPSGDNSATHESDKELSGTHVAPEISEHTDAPSVPVAPLLNSSYCTDHSTDDVTAVASVPVHDAIAASEAREDSPPQPKLDSDTELGCHDEIVDDKEDDDEVFVYTGRDYVPPEPVDTLQLFGDERGAQEDPSLDLRLSVQPEETVVDSEPVSIPPVAQAPAIQTTSDVHSSPPRRLSVDTSPSSDSLDQGVWASRWAPRTEESHVHSPPPRRLGVETSPSSDPLGQGLRASRWAPRAEESHVHPSPPRRLGVDASPSSDPSDQGLRASHWAPRAEEFHVHSSPPKRLGVDTSPSSEPLDQGLRASRWAPGAEERTVARSAAPVDASRSVGIPVADEVVKKNSGAPTGVLVRNVNNKNGMKKDRVRAKGATAYTAAATSSGLGFTPPTQGCIADTGQRNNSGGRNRRGKKTIVEGIADKPSASSGSSAATCPGGGVSGIDGNKSKWGGHRKGKQPSRSGPSTPRSSVMAIPQRT